MNRVFTPSPEITGGMVHFFDGMEFSIWLDHFVFLPVNRIDNNYPCIKTYPHAKSGNDWTRNVVTHIDTALME